MTKAPSYGFWESDNIKRGNTNAFESKISEIKCNKQNMFHLSFSIWMMIALTGNQQQRRNVHVRLIMWFALVKVWLHPLTQAATLLCAKIIKSLWHISQHVPAQHFREKILIKFQTFDTEQILKCQNSKWWTGQNKSVMCVLRKTNYHIVLQDIIWDCEGLLMMMVWLMVNEMVQVARDTTRPSLKRVIFVVKLKVANVSFLVVVMMELWKWFGTLGSEKLKSQNPLVLRGNCI